MSEDVREAALAGIPGATGNESSVAGAPPPPPPGSGERNFVTGPVGSQPVPAAEVVVTEPAEPEVKAPPQSAPKDAWVEHAVAMGDDLAVAKDMTKADLIEKHG